MRRLIFIFVLFTISLNLYGQSPLCSSYPTNFCCEYVSSVTINGQTYAGSNGYTAGSGGTGPNGYYDYTDSTPIPTINAGDTIAISYTAETNGNYMEYFKLWVDFNGNGVLSDSGEQIYSYNVSWLGSKTVTSYFIVPTSVYNGTVYLRFMMVYANVPALCGSYAYGNTFDFKTTIQGAQPNPNLGVTDSISGNIDIPSGLSTLPTVKLYYVKSTGDSLVETVTVDSQGNYSLTPHKYNDTFKVVPSFSGGTISQTDFDSVFIESQFENTPDNTPIGTILNTGAKLRAADVNNDGKITLVDTYLIGRHLGGFTLLGDVLWYDTSGYSSLTTSNFNTIPSSQYFIVNFGTSSVTLDMKYIIVGDADLSHSTQ